jgi:uncharacterized HAD superfamily protein
MKIGVDIDEVIAETINAVIAFHNEAYGTTLKKADFSSYDCHEIWGGTEEEAILKWHEFFETDHFTSISPIAGAYPALLALKQKGHELFAITARQHLIAKQTEDWVDEYFPDIFSGIYFGNRSGLEGIKRKKSDMCTELGITILIEDDLHHANDCVKHGIEVFLFDKPWNQKELPNNAQRVHSWSDIMGMIS